MINLCPSDPEDCITLADSADPDEMPPYALWILKKIITFLHTISLICSVADPEGVPLNLHPGLLLLNIL